MHKYFITFVGIIIIAIVGVSLFRLTGSPNGEFAASPDESASPNESSGDIPNLSLEDLGGNTVNLADFKGKPLVLNAWAAWCPFCVDELADFASAQKEFGDRVNFVAIDRAESLKTAKEFTDKIGVTDDLIFLLDPKDSFYKEIGGFSMPETLFIDSDGKIKEHVRGPLNLNEIREKTKALF